MARLRTAENIVAPPGNKDKVETLSCPVRSAPAKQAGGDACARARVWPIGGVKACMFLANPIPIPMRGAILAASLCATLPLAGAGCANITGVQHPPGCIPELEDGCAALNHCNGRGVCRDGAEFASPSELARVAKFTTAVCLCESAWRGPACEVPTCPNDCNSRGRCIVPPPPSPYAGSGPHMEPPPPRCECDAGWGGVDCGVHACPAGCSGRGNCAGQRCDCEPGWGGAACDTRLCWPSPSCSGRGSCVDGRCHCDSDWHGAACQLRSCPRDCSGRGTCTEAGTCSCDRGFGGADCSEFACPIKAVATGNGSAPPAAVACSGHGRCLGYGTPERVCKCDEGWGSDDCSSRACAPPGCGPHGACVEGRCYCEVGYDGPRCEVSRCPHGCGGHGRCDGHRCVCDAGWEGDDCTEPACAGGCGERQFCYRGRCACLPGYSGLTVVVGSNRSSCMIRTCPRGCSEPHGRCEDGACVCVPGYGGERCERRVCPVASSVDNFDEDAAARTRLAVPGPDHAGEPGSELEHGRGIVCAGHGTCVGGRCACDEGWRDYDCTRRACENGCSGNGHCAPDGTCSCYPGYFGADCALDSCLHNCSWPNGSCSRSAPAWLGYSAPQALCVCAPGWRGVSCELRACPGTTSSDGGEACAAEAGCVECSGHGSCGDDGVCTCVAPWSGDDCARYGCGPAGCGAHGTCMPTEVAGHYACACEPGWGGDDCSLRACGGGCGGAGWCRDGACVCFPGAATDEAGVCSKAAARREVSLECSLKCVRGCAELCEPGQGSGDGLGPGGVGKSELACNAECTGQCVKVCAGE